MKIKYLVLHTAAYDGEHDSLENIIRWHKQRGFRTIGYNYYIRKDGSIKKGREEGTVGAHCRANGMNHKSIGICFEGHHDKEHWTNKQKRAFYILCQVLITKYNIPKENIIGHREAYTMQGKESPKTCPGKKIDMDKVRNKYGIQKTHRVKPQELHNLIEGHIDFTDKINRL